MRSEAVGVAEAVRLLALVAGALGIVQITPEEEIGLVAGITSVIAAASLALSIFARAKVFSRKTVEEQFISKDVVP